MTKWTIHTTDTALCFVSLFLSISGGVGAEEADVLYYIDRARIRLTAAQQGYSFIRLRRRFMEDAAGIRQSRSLRLFVSWWWWCRSCRGTQKGPLIKDEVITVRPCYPQVSCFMKLLIVDEGRSSAKLLLYYMLGVTFGVVEEVMGALWSDVVGRAGCVF